MVYGLVKKRAVILGKAGRVKIMEGEIQLFKMAEASSLEKLSEAWGGFLRGE